MIDIIGAPFDLCGMRPGSRMGPAAVRLAGLEKSLSALDEQVRDKGNARSPDEATLEGGLANFEPLHSCLADLIPKIRTSLGENAIPIVVGGEHTLAVAGISAALQIHGSDLAVVWIDAHADANTPGSSLTGNIHGMPLAALWGLPSETGGLMDEQWRRLLAQLGPQRLDPKRTAWLGLRDVDEPERDRLNGIVATMHDIDRYGVERNVVRIDRWLRDSGARSLWISFDVDSLDPFLAPGTGTAVRGGLSYREAHLIAELFHELLIATGCPYQLVGLDLMETNPIYDTLNQTAIMAVEWTASLFGKTILGKRTPSS